MPFSLKIVSSKDFQKIAEKYPEKIRKRILHSQGFADTHRNIAFVKSKRDVTSMAGVAIHEILELLSDVSPHDIDGIRCKGDEPQQPEVKYTTPPMTPEQQDYYKNYYKPYLESKKGIYEQFMAPSSRQIGGLLQADLTQPFQLPESVWQDVWQKGREKTLAEYEPIERRTTQRFAGTGALDTSGQVQKAFGEIELSKAKSIEDLAVGQAIAEWNEKKAAKQSSYENMFRYLGYQPSFNMQLPQTQTTIQPGSKDNQMPWWLYPLGGWDMTEGYKW